jgi:hypothetical protein
LFYGFNNGDRIPGRGILFYNVGKNNDEEIELNVEREDFKVIK